LGGTIYAIEINNATRNKFAFAFLKRHN